jgi:hypothetical protein
VKEQAMQAVLTREQRKELLDLMAQATALLELKEMEPVMKGLLRHLKRKVKMMQHQNRTRSSTAAASRRK